MAISLQVSRHPLTFSSDHNVFVNDVDYEAFKTSALMKDDVRLCFL
jgi:hypothetical protein